MPRKDQICDYCREKLSKKYQTYTHSYGTGESWTRYICEECSGGVYDAVRNLFNSGEGDIEKSMEYYKGKRIEYEEENRDVEL